MSASILGRWFVLLALAAAVPAFADGQGTCEHAVAKSSAKFVGAAFKSAQRCLALRGAGKLPATSCQLAGESTGDSRTDAALAHAESRLRQGLAPCPAQVIGAMGFGASCAAVASGASFGPADLQRCITETHMQAVQALVSVEFPQQTSDCGDGVIDSGEDCDPVASPTGCGAGETCVPAGPSDECTCIESSSTCGNGTVDSGEACDPSATPTGCPTGMTCGVAGTSGQCTCSDTSGNQCQGTCTPACTGTQQCTCTCSSGTCGNGTRDPGEQCDPMANPSGCAAGMVCGAPGTAQQCTCFTQSGTCGNGMLDPGEGCDPALPNTCDPGEVCLSSGAMACTCGAPPSNCGNGLVEWGEQCDPAASPTGCPTGETCGARGTAEACTCTSGGTPMCGNGMVDSGEQCDPAANPTGCAAGQTCSGQCTCSGGGQTCGNGTLDPGEQCDPTANPTGCPTGSTCSATCTCGGGPPPNCNCCPGANSLIRFTNGIGSGNCGTVSDAGNTLLFNLQCGGLYTGAGASTLSNPAAPPDMGTEYIKPSACSGASYTILPTVPADLTGVGGNQRNCTSAGVADPDYPACAGGSNAGRPCVTDADCPSSTCSSTMPGCLFGAPLAIPNPSFTGASVCVVNRVQTNASGSGDCSTGATNLNLPLASDLYLTGDLLDGSAPDRPLVTGINPCPICNPATNLCQGGPRNGLACHPDTSVLNAAYPTSHDCPPPPGPLGSNYIGALPIPFNLTTGSQTSTAVNTGGAGQEVFCGFCGSANGPTFHNPPMPCANDAACTGVTGCPGTVACSRCKQRDSGAFNLGPAPGSEHVISVMGSSAGVCLADAAPHAATLVSAFCIPPAYNATVDANGDLPGPGAVSLPGMTTLVP